MKVHILGAHNCEGQNTRLVSLLVDDQLVLDAGGLTSSLSFEAQKKLRAILITHYHYDHIRDIPLLAMNLYLKGATINIYSILAVRDALSTNLLNGQLYPNFLEKPPHNPTIRFNLMEPYRAVPIEGYSVLTVPTNHAVPTVGYLLPLLRVRLSSIPGIPGPVWLPAGNMYHPSCLLPRLRHQIDIKNLAGSRGILPRACLKKS